MKAISAIFALFVAVVIAFSLNSYVPAKTAAAEITSPTDGATGVSHPTTIYWTQVGDKNTTYTLQVSVNSSFSPMFYEKNDISGTSHLVNTNSNTTYYTHVKANLLGEDYGETIHFTTAP